MARIRFIIDPVEARIGKLWPFEENKIRELTTDYSIHIVRGRSHAAALARQAREEKCELIVCVGGDQAMNEIANALYPPRKGDPLISVHGDLQCGEFVKSQAFRKNFIEFLRDFFDQKSIEERVDLGLIHYTGEYGQRLQNVFLNYASFGYAAMLINRLPAKVTPFKALQILFRTLPFYKISQFRFQRSQEIPSTESLLTGFVNLSAFGPRGLKIASEAQTLEGQFVLTKVKKANSMRYLLAALQSAFGRSSHGKFLERVFCREIKIESTLVGRTVRIDIDGESRGYLPAEIQMKEKALRIVR